MSMGSHTALRRSKSAPHMHILVCICSNTEGGVRHTKARVRHTEWGLRTEGGPSLSYSRSQRTKTRIPSSARSHKAVPDSNRHMGRATDAILRRGWRVGLSRQGGKGTLRMQPLENHGPHKQPLLILEMLRTTDGQHMVIRNPQALCSNFHIRCGGEHPPNDHHPADCMRSLPAPAGERTPRGHKQPLCGGTAVRLSPTETRLPTVWGQTFFS